MNGRRALGIQVGLREDLCTHAKVKTSRCRLCLECCPVHAVSLAPGPWVDGSRCTGCGACAAFCPTGAFFLLDEEELKVQGSGELAISCAAVEPSQGTWLPCLAALSPGLLASALGQQVQTVSLSYGDCQKCVNGPAMAARGEIREWVQAVARACGRDGIAVRELRTSSFVESMKPGIRRRSLIRWLGKKPGGLRPTPWKEGVEARGLPLGTVRRVGDCFLCPVCVIACPAEALKLEGSKLLFHSERCNGCRACVEACGFQALELAPYFSRGQTLLAEGVSFSCQVCGEEGIGTGHICPRCQREKRSCAASFG